MRIGIEAQRLFRKKRFGMDIVALELIKHLQKLDMKNEYFIFVKPGENKEDFELINPNFRLVEIESKTYIDWEQIHLPRVSTKLNLDLLHCTNNTAPIFCKTPIVLTLHDTIFFDKIEIFDTKIPVYQSWGNLYRKLIVSVIINKIGIVVTVSDFERQLMIKRFGLSDNKIKRIYNGVGEDFLKSVSPVKVEEFRANHEIKGKYLLFMGNLHPRKNMVRVLKAFLEWKTESGSDVKLLITNLSTEDYHTICQSEGINLSDNDIILAGYIGRIELPTLLSGSEALLYPSLREGFGIPILEAFACGVPVITSNTSSMPEVAGSAALVVDPFSVNDIRNAISRIIDNPSLKGELTAIGRQRALQFSWQSSAEEYLKVYESIGKRV